MAADWGQRLLSADSQLYDPLSYHYGSVWPLFTGWTGMAAYAYGRPAVGYRAVMTNALLTWPWALGYVTELLSGAFHAPFGRSSHHQVWSEAMVVTPLVRGLLGIEVTDGGRRLRFAPQLPADWDRVGVKRVAAGLARVDLSLERGSGRMTISAITTAGVAPKLTVAPAFPLDARIRAVTVDGSDARFQVRPEGDVQRAEVALPASSAASRRVVFTYDEGTDVYARVELPAAGSESEGLRILSSRAGVGALNLSVEGRGGRQYEIEVRTRRRVEGTTGVRVTPRAGGATLTMAFEGPGDTYSRRQIVLPLH